jgi:hypothetical protein
MKELVILENFNQLNNKQIKYLEYENYHIFITNDKEILMFFTNFYPDCGVIEFEDKMYINSQIHSNKEFRDLLINNEVIDNNYM